MMTHTCLDVRNDDTCNCSVNELIEMPALSVLVKH